MINTIDINAKEWFDNKNGNSYFAGIVTLNYGTETQETFLMQFQNGYGNQYEQEAKAILTQFNKISLDYGLSLYSYCLENDIIFRTSLEKNCLKRELTQIETNYNNNL
tara:strand:+ start:115 stop:438 length:324 start_codon:yes stop_codon:yes gene_type:complete